MQPNSAILNLAGLQSSVDRLTSTMQSLGSSLHARASAAAKPESDQLSGVAGLIGGASVATIAGAVISTVKGVFDEMKSAITNSMSVVFETLRGGFNTMKSVILETVGAFRPFEVEMFNRSIRDLQAVFGTIFLPVLQSVTRGVRQLADYFYNLSPAVKDLIAFSAKLTLVLGAVAIVVSGIASVGAGIATILSPLILFVALMPLIAAAVIPIVGPFVALAGVFAALGGVLVAFNWSKVVGTFEKIFNNLQVLAEATWAQVQPVWNSLKTAFGGLSGQLEQLWESFKPLAAIGIGAIALGIRGALTMMIQGLQIFVTILTGLVARINRIVSVFGLPTIDLPDIQGGKASAFNLGQHGGTVTDPMSAFKMMQEEILKNAGAAQKEAKDDRMRDNIDKMSKFMETVEKDVTAIKEFLTNVGKEFVGNLNPFKMFK